MNTFTSYIDNTPDITLLEPNKSLRIFFTALFLTAVFIIPALAAVHFLASPFIKLW